MATAGRAAGAAPRGLRLPWAALPHDLPVQVTADRKYLGRGTVDGATPDGSVLWVLFNGMEGRRMFNRDDHIHVEVG